LEQLAPAWQRFSRHEFVGSDLMRAHQVDHLGVESSGCKECTSARRRKRKGK
jgi:hypothetical protein